jgi:hypothetical protein
MKTLISNQTPDYCSEVVLHNFDGKDTRFKITVENGNSYFRVKIYIHTLNGDFSIVASNDDIPGLTYISYIYKNDERLQKGIDNVEICKAYIQTVF